MIDMQKGLATVTTILEASRTSVTSVPSGTANILPRWTNLPLRQAYHQHWQPSVHGTQAATLEK